MKNGELDLGELLQQGYVLLDNKGKIEVIKRPEYGNIMVTFHNNVPTYKDVNTKEKIT